MEKIEWSSFYDLGIEQIDVQHQNLVFLINEAYELIANKIPQHSEEVQDLLVKISNYAVYHFDTEESLFEMYKFPKTAQHKVEHNEFKYFVSKNLELFDNGKLELVDIVDFLKNWLLNHIAIEDKAFAPFLKEKGII